MKQITVHERFLSFQGEGDHAGRSAYFIRTYGCPIHCQFCDSSGTWHPDYKPDNMERLSMRELALTAILSGAAICVLTGGEPAMHDWTEFFEAHQESLNYQTVHIETSGAFPVRGEFDWITVSPKRAKEPLPENYRRANELKLIIESPEDIDYWMGKFDHAFLRSVWLHPEWSKRDNPVVIKAIVDAVKKYPRLCRAGWQLHKLYSADRFDSGTRQEVPLGGRV